jgi:uncharacterized protein YndB with AHSA1/START domain
MTAAEPIRLERTYDTSPTAIWAQWTTAEGIESWWSPDGFVAQVRNLDVRPGGELVYAITATAPAQVEFMSNAGMPLTTESRKTFTEVRAPTRRAYTSLIDFVPDTDPYEHLTVVDLTPAGDRVTVLMTVEPLHDQVWTDRLLTGRANELDNLETIISQRNPT